MDEQGTNNHEELLARWIAGQATDQELEQLAESGLLEQYARIIEEVDTWEVPPMDVQASFEKLKTKKQSNQAEPAAPLKTVPTDQPTGKVVPLYKQRWFAVAAGIAAIVGLFGLFNIGGGDTTIVTAFGETQSVVLPDSTSVLLLANSSLSFDEDGWQDDREVELNGGAYFDVETGSTFSVETEMGTVQVLGTQFEVHVEEGFFKASCYEGKVKFKANDADETPILTAGNGAIFTKEKGLETVDNPNKEFIPPVGEGVTKYIDASLREVLYGLTRQYGVTFVGAGAFMERRFSGGYPNNSLDDALELVFGPLNIKYERDGRRVTVSN